MLVKSKPKVLKPEYFQYFSIKNPVQYKNRAATKPKVTKKILSFFKSLALPAANKLIIKRHVCSIVLVKISKLNDKKSNLTGNKTFKYLVKFLKTKTKATIKVAGTKAKTEHKRLVSRLFLFKSLKFTKFSAE